jgi:hypothetical protein
MRSTNPETMQLSQSPLSFSLSGPDIFLRTLFLNSLGLYFFHKVRDKDSHHIKQHKIMTFVAVQYKWELKMDRLIDPVFSL